MIGHRKILQLLSIAALASAATVCRAGDGVAVKVANDGTEDIIVTIYDASASPARSVLARERINGFTVVPIQVVAGSDGKATLSWTAMTADTRSPHCGKGENVEVGDADQLTISADGTCSL